jgi:hypothetical protein
MNRAIWIPLVVLLLGAEKIPDPKVTKIENGYQASIENWNNCTWQGRGTTEKEAVEQLRGNIGQKKAVRCNPNPKVKK